MIRLQLFIGVLFVSVQAYTQKPPLIEKLPIYKETVRVSPQKQMLEIRETIPSVVYDLRYATTQNFMNRKMYPSSTNKTFLRRDAVFALRAVQGELNRKGLGLKIFDAYRPWSVSKKFWDLVKDERYVANPARGSNHNRGIAVDLTIINLKTGEALDMGTGFDDFTDAAHHSFKNLPDRILKNRELLKTVMERNGFSAYNEEWWHYTFKSDIKFEVLDIPFKKLNKIK